MDILSRVEPLKERFKEVESLLSDSEIVSQADKLRDLSKEYHHLKEVITLSQKYEHIVGSLEENESLLKSVVGDPEMTLLCQEEIESLKLQKKKEEQSLFIKLFPPDPSDSRNVIVEIRAGTGGDEAALFVADLFRMYTLYSEKESWKVEVLSTSDSILGGYKEVILGLRGKDVYRFMKYESGIHRVQRVPETESSGRIHTSAASVAILPEAEEVEMEIDPKDLRIDVYRSGGPGGQSVNTMDSAVRVTHIPTGVVVQCQDGKSQLQNKNQALKILRSRLLAHKEQEESNKRSQQRKVQVGGGDRSEKVRTYNFPQGRVTDHRIPMSIYDLSGFLNGQIDVFFQHLLAKMIENE